MSIKLESEISGFYLNTFLEPLAKTNPLKTHFHLIILAKLSLGPWLSLRQLPN